MAVSTISAVTVFGFSYDLPAGSLRVDEINGASPNTDKPFIRFRHDWELETNTILSTLKEIDLLYINQVTTTTEWDILFTEMFISQLALNLLGSTAGMGSSTINFRQLLLKELKELRKQTRAVGSDEKNNAGDSNWNNARFRGLGILHNSERFR